MKGDIYQGTNAAMLFLPKQNMDPFYKEWKLLPDSWGTMFIWYSIIIYRARPSVKGT